MPRSPSAEAAFLMAWGSSATSPLPLEVLPPKMHEPGAGPSPHLNVPAPGYLPPTPGGAGPLRA